MPRQSRIVLPNVAHHVTQRGNYQQPVFESERDFRIYSESFKTYSEKYDVQTYAYCLMSNHVHFVVMPKTEDGLARVFSTVHMKYAQYFNKRRDITGHLWQGRFFSCLLDEAHLYRAIRYVERNPVRAKIVPEAWNYVWSSAAEHVGQNRGMIPLTKTWNMAGEEWIEYLKEPDQEMVDEMRSKTQKGHVIGSEKFIEEIQNKLNRSLTYLAPGRPKKEISKKGSVPIF